MWNLKKPNLWKYRVEWGYQRLRCGQDREILIKGYKFPAKYSEDLMYNIVITINNSVLYN